VRDRQLVPLSPKSFDVLVTLVRRAGHLVPREELMAQVWRGTFVEEANLNYTISLLRKALSDAADEPRYIQTVSKQGYRFIATVDRISNSPAPNEGWVATTVPEADLRTAADWSTSTRQGGLRLTLGAAVIAMLLVALGSGLYIASGRLKPSIRTDAPQDVRSVAVLPLANVSANLNDEWFSDGMTDAIIGELSRINQLRVISRMSTMRYKETRKNLPEIARELKVDGIVSGTVMREGSLVRISVQLYHGPTEALLWGQTYQRELRSVLALHSEVALALARHIRVRLTTVEQASLQRPRTTDVEAYEAFLKGRYQRAKLTPEGVAASIDIFQTALAKKEDYAPVIAELALAYWIQASFLTQSPSNQALQTTRTKALSLALRAVQLDDTSAEAHATLGWFRFWSLDWASAERSFQRAIDLDASNVNARHGYAFYFTSMGRFDEAIVQIRQARELDPASPTIAIAAHWPYYCAHRFEEAASELAEARAMEPSNATVLTFLGNVRSMQGRHAEALVHLQAAAELGGGTSPRFLAILTGAYARAGKVREAQKTLTQIITHANRGYVSPMWLARAHAAAGRGDDALTWLERAYEADPVVDDLTTIRDPVWDGVRTQARFKAVLSKMGV